MQSACPGKNRDGRFLCMFTNSRARHNHQSFLSIGEIIAVDTFDIIGLLNRYTNTVFDHQSGQFLPVYKNDMLCIVHRDIKY